MSNKPTLQTVAEIAQAYRRHPVTVRLALEKGELHGRQRVPRGRWVIETICADAWAGGERCPHYAPRIPQLRRTKRS